MEIHSALFPENSPSSNVISKLHWSREDTKFMDWKWDMLFTRHLWELQNTCRHFCHCHFRFASEIYFVFTLQQKLVLSLIMYIVVPSSVRREEYGEENGWFELQLCESKINAIHSSKWRGLCLPLTVMSLISVARHWIVCSTKDRNMTCSVFLHVIVLVMTLYFMKQNFLFSF